VGGFPPFPAMPTVNAEVMEVVTPRVTEISRFSPHLAQPVRTVLQPRPQGAAENGLSTEHGTGRPLQR